MNPMNLPILLVLLILPCLYCMPGAGMISRAGMNISRGRSRERDMQMMPNSNSATMGESHRRSRSRSRDHGTRLENLHEMSLARPSDHVESLTQSMSRMSINSASQGSRDSGYGRTHSRTRSRSVSRGRTGPQRTRSRSRSRDSQGFSYSRDSQGFSYTQGLSRSRSRTRSFGTRSYSRSRSMGADEGGPETAPIPIEAFAMFLGAIRKYLMDNGIVPPYTREILETKMTSQGRATFLSMLGNMPLLSNGIGNAFKVIGAVPNADERAKSILACWTLATLVYTTIDVVERKGKSMEAVPGFQKVTPEMVNFAYNESQNIDLTISEIQEPALAELLSLAQADVTNSLIDSFGGDFVTKSTSRSVTMVGGRAVSKYSTGSRVGGGISNTYLSGSMSRRPSQTMSHSNAIVSMSRRSLSREGQTQRSGRSLSREGQTQWSGRSLSRDGQTQWSGRSRSRSRYGVNTTRGRSRSRSAERTGQYGSEYRSQQDWSNNQQSGLRHRGTKFRSTGRY